MAISVAKYLDGLTRREGLKVSVSRAQVGEIARIINDDSGGAFYLLIKRNFFFDRSKSLPTQGKGAGGVRARLR